MQWQRFSAVLVVFCAIAIFNAGCGATIGPAPAKLSAEVGDRIAEMQGLHQVALKRYFESERKRVETFLQEKWVPRFLENFLSTSELMEDLIHLESESDRLPLIIEWVSDAQAAIELKRKEVLQPLNEAEMTVTLRITQEYTQLLKANGVVTARIEAAAKKAEVQNKLLDAFGLKKPADLLSLFPGLNVGTKAIESLMKDIDVLKQGEQ